MSTTHVQGKAIHVGYEWRIRLVFKSAEGPVSFPAGASFLAHIREYDSSPTILATLSTANGAITRRNSNTIDIVLSPEDSAAMRPLLGSKPKDVVMDVVRVDTNPEDHLGVHLRVPIVNPVTRD